jgi:hypothetical protein
MYGRFGGLVAILGLSSIPEDVADPVEFQKTFVTLFVTFARASVREREQAPCRIAASLCAIGQIV